jgi:uroporphyrinogen-III synthase
MNILITRPLIEAEDLMEKFFAYGHKIIHLPTLKIFAIETELVNSNNFGAFIFTSANAVRNLKLTNVNKNLHCFCVGSIT